MALHEHQSAALAAPSGVASLMSDGERLAAHTRQIMDAASAAVLSGDVTAYATALTRIDELGHPNRRHQARLRSIEVVLLPHEGMPAAALARLMGRALDALTRWLLETPAEPTLLGYAGTLASELGLLREADALFTAALRLEPGRQDHEDSLAAVTARRAARTRPAQLPADVRHSLSARRAPLTRIARSAVPRDGLRISLCMIVRDEEEMLPRCLEAARQGVDEIVIVDTGSRDRTVQIAESFGARVLHHPWTGDFSQARNLGLDAATGDWLLWLDADEVLVAEDAAKLRALASHTWRECFRISMVHHLGDVDDGEQAMHSSLRMARNRPEYRFSGRVHEQIADTFPGYLIGERFEHTDVRVDHFGYLGQVRDERGKSSRNLELILGQIQDGDDSAFVHFNLGSEYLVFPDAASQRKALGHLRIAYGKVTSDLDFKIQGFLPALVLRYVRSLRMHGEHAEMDEVCGTVAEHFPGFTDLVYEQALAAIDRDDHAQARALLEECLALGDAPAIYSPTVGCGSSLAQLRLAQLDLAGGDVDGAVRRYRSARASHPHYLGLIDPYAGVLLARGDDPAQVLAELTAGHDLSPSGWFMVGVNFQERGHLAQAQAAFRGALERRPTLDHARVALADTLLVQGRIAEAIAEAERVPADVRVGGAALRTAIFARLVAEDPSLHDALPALIDALPRSPLDDATQAVLAAWVAARLGDESPPLGPEHIGPASALIDPALRLGAADAFAELAALLAATGLERRGQHELLATAFLRQGLLELAADEWVAAVQEDGPDADAYAGLAELARLRDLPEDARTLASEALAIDPAHGLAGRVLAALEG